MSIKEATRDSYGKALSEFAEEYDLYVLDADLAAATKTGIFKKAYPERFIECGIAEGNMMGVAAGLAAAGKTVFASTFAMFAAGRAFEQIRNSIGYPHLNVKIGATHAGISVGEDGATHQCNEDIALMRTIPGMVVLNPADPVEARLCVKAAIEHQGPVYLRFGRMAVDSIFDENYQFEIGRGVVLKEGKDVAIIATGLMTQRALKAAEILSLEGIDAAVINMASIKPLDNDLVLRYAAKCGAIVTTEEHSVIGGLGGAVCELICEQGKCPVIRHGVEDQFGKSGPAADLLDLFELNAEGIAEKARYAVSLKK
ncbi:MAG: transketolase [Clostridiales bacterium]|nr:MAG: transketolase [Clostridiales bacterium]